MLVGYYILGFGRRAIIPFGRKRTFCFIEAAPPMKSYGYLASVAFFACILHLAHMRWKQFILLRVANLTRSLSSPQRQRKIMKLEHAASMYMEYHRMNSGKNTIESYWITLDRFRDHFGLDRELSTITSGISTFRAAWSTV